MEHTYLVCYDIADQKRWRRIFKTMKGYGEWMQLSVFQCRLSRMHFLRMTDTLKGLLNQNEDHLLIIDLGPAESVNIRVESYGKKFVPIQRQAVVV